MTPNKQQTIDNEINNLLLNEIKKLNCKCTSRESKQKYNRKIFVKAFIKRLKTGNTWNNLQDEFKVSNLNRKLFSKF